MLKRILFGTDGIRGQANVYPMTVEIALALGRGVAYLVKQGRLGLLDQGHRKRIVIGKDTRISGYCFEQAIAAGICSMGVDVMLVGPLPTPGIAFITKSMRADAGIVVSASHNSFEDNGIKIFDQNGFKLPDEMELELEELILTDKIAGLRPTGEAMGKAKRIDDAVGRYIVYLKTAFPEDLTLDGLKIVLDCANGSAYKVAPEVLKELGAEIICIGDKPDGLNINKDSGPLSPQMAQEKVLATKADLGIVLDGDADRISLIDENGEVVPGEILMALITKFLQESCLLSKSVLVTTDMSNLGLDTYLKTIGVTVKRVAVGDRYVVEHMRAQGYNWGGEESGHLIYFDKSTTGDGMIGALLLLTLIKRQHKTVSEISKIFNLIPRAVRNIKVSQKLPFAKLPASSAMMKKIEARLGSAGRLFVRYSGTESKVRILVEGPNVDEINQMADELSAQLFKEIN